MPKRIPLSEKGRRRAAVRDQRMKKLGRATVVVLAVLSVASLAVALGYVP